MANTVKTFRSAQKRGLELLQAPSIFCLFIISLFYLTAGTNSASAATYYCDPVSGNTTQGDGSAESPWGTLESVFDAGSFHSTIQGGDTVKLRSGYHGWIREYGYHNEDYITIEAEAGHTPGLRSFNLLGATKWIIRGLTVSPELAPGDFVPVGKYISIENHNTWGESSDSIIENCVIYSMQDSSAWTIEEWNNLPGYMGIHVEGPNHIVRNNTLKNVCFGVVAGGDNILVENNTIINFTGDGLRVSGGKDQVWQYNTVKNCYDVSANHDDGLQVYTGGTEVHNLIIRGNYILEYEDPNQPFRGSLQGILCSQGPDTNFGWIVENNVVVVTWHGIAIKDPANSKIVNNTVIRPPASPHEEYYPQITLYSDSDGIQYGSNTVIRNNMAGNFPAQDEADGVIVDHNLDIDDYDPNVLFVDYQNFDLRHKAGSPAIDAGSSDMAPDTDIEGNVRPYDGDESGSVEFDIGAYEYGASNGTPQPPEPPEPPQPPDPPEPPIEPRADLPDVTSVKVSNNIIKKSGNTSAIIQCNLKEAGNLTVKIYDTKGREIITLCNEHKEAGRYEFFWAGDDAQSNKVGSGIYIVHMKAGGYSENRKIAVIK